MKLKYLYEMYDNGVKQGERTSKEWADMLQVSIHLVRDYAREGRAYKGRYKFNAVREECSEEAQQEEPEITVQDLQKFKRSLKIGTRFVHNSFRKDFVRGTQVTSEKVVVARKFPHIVELVSLNDPKRSVTMTYMELLKQRNSRKKQKLTAGR